MDKNFFVYALIDLRTNMPFYIGKGKILDNKNRTFRRIKDHLRLDGKNKLKNFIIRKNIKQYGYLSYVILCNKCNEQSAFRLEEKLINFYGRRDLKTGILSNLTNGGDGCSGYIRTKQTRLRQSTTMLTKYKKGYLNPFCGERHNLHSKLKMSIAQKKRNLNGSNNPFFGKNHSEKTKETLSNYMKRRWEESDKNDYKKYGLSGCKNNFAKKYRFVDPNGKQFIVHGRFKDFVKQNELALTVCKQFIDKGIIPEPINPKHSRMTINRLNSTGWLIETIK